MYVYIYIYTYIHISKITLKQVQNQLMGPHLGDVFDVAGGSSVFLEILWDMQLLGSKDRSEYELMLSCTYTYTYTYIYIYTCVCVCICIYSIKRQRERGKMCVCVSVVSSLSHHLIDPAFRDPVVTSSKASSQPGQCASWMNSAENGGWFNGWQSTVKVEIS